MSTFTDAFNKEANRKLTENGAEAFKSTNSAVLDFFATVGALRQRSEEDIIAKFDAAYAEDKLIATKILFYGRDVRGGCGERRTARIILKHCASKHPEAIIENLDLIGVYGRYDDLYTLVGTPLEKQMWAAMRKQWSEDVASYEKGEVISLLAKWIKTPDSKSAETKRLGILTCKNITDDCNVYTFKRTLRKLRKHIDLVETRMCQGDWQNIKYSAVPSRAMRLYRNAFLKHDTDGFNDYLVKVEQGTEKINAGTLYPYDIVRSYLDYLNTRCVPAYVNIAEDTVLEEQWKALPNYVVDVAGKPKECNIVVMADVSGSMYCCDNMPISSSVGLAIYFAQRNTGAFHNMFMTFSRSPEFVKLRDGVSLWNNIAQTSQADWGYGTDFMGAMHAILKMCKDNQVAPEDVPEALVCISDMEFDSCGTFDSDTVVDVIDREFEEAGYKRPTLVFWNVAARNDTYHITTDMGNAVLVSGHSVSAFKTVVNSVGMTAYEAMLFTLNSERYAAITIAE